MTDRPEPMLLICPTCDGLGSERRQITHPESNVANWYREGEWPSKWWRRRCQHCAGEGFVPEPVPSVPLVDGRQRHD